MNPQESITHGPVLAMPVGANTQGLPIPLDRLSMIQVMSVAAGHKPCSRQYVAEKHLGILQDFFGSLGLHMVPSEYRILPERNPTQSGYSNRARRLPRSHTSGKLIVYVSKDAFTAREAVSADEKQDHNAVGELLGYPECCVSFFLSGLSSFSMTNMDLTFLLGRTMRIYPYFNNYALRCVGYALLDHFPCSLECLHSQRLAALRLSLIERRFPHLADLFTAALRSMVLYTQDEGVFYSKSYHVNLNRVNFDDLNGTTPSDLQRHLLLSRSIRLAENGALYAGDRLVHENATLQLFG